MSRDDSIKFDYTTNRLPVAMIHDVTTAIWSAALDLNEVCSTDNFFELGGNSMVAIQLIYDIETALDIRLPVDILFIDGTLASVTNTCIELYKEKSMRGSPANKNVASSG